MIRLERDGAIAAITVDRPEARNALTSEMRGELLQICLALSDDRDVRVVTLRGAGGKTFISGADIKEFAALESAQDFIEQARRDEELYGAIERLPAVTVAVIEGHALGGGLMLAALCDVRICTPDAKFGITSARNLSNCLSPGMYARLAALLGHGRAKHLLIRAQILDAATALAWGLVTDVADRDALDETVAAITAELAGFAPLTTWATKEAMRRLVDFPRDEDIMERVLSSEDFREGVAAFIEKRRPVWRNR
jgi:enoyl-CoA hydratase/carnithine racemase